MSSPTQTTDRGLPVNEDAEKTILGAILLDNAAWFEASARIEAADFFFDSHRRIFLRMSELMNARRPVDIVTLANELARAKEIEAVGGVAYLASLTEGLPLRPVIDEYVRIVKDKALLRRIMALGEAAIDRAADQSETAFEVLGSLETQMLDIGRKGIGTTALQRACDFFAKSFPTAESMTEHAVRTQGVKTGFEDFDKMTSGLRRGELIIVAARPAMGKTALIINIAEHAAIDAGLTVAIFSMEMSKEAVFARGICSRGHVPFQNYKSGSLDSEDERYFHDAHAEWAEAPVFIDDTPGLTLSQMRGSLRRLKAEGPLDLVEIDYLQLMSFDDAPKKYTREQEVGWATRGLKALAKELDVPVVLLCALSRANTQRENKRPQLSDLRESGSIEQDADLVIFPHRPIYYEPNNTELRGKDELIIGKQRNGPVGAPNVPYEPGILRWSDPNKFREQTDFVWG